MSSPNDLWYQQGSPRQDDPYQAQQSGAAGYAPQQPVPYGPAAHGYGSVPGHPPAATPRNLLGEAPPSNNAVAVVVIVVALVLTLGALVGGGFLAYRFLASDGPAAADHGPERGDVVVPDNTYPDAGGGMALGPDLAVTGEVDPALPELVIYSDYACVHCGECLQLHREDLEELAASGEATVVYRPVANLAAGDTGSWSFRATRAAAIVADGAPEAFHEFHRNLFEHGVASGSELSDAELTVHAMASGVPDEVAQAITDERFDAWVDAITHEAHDEGVTTTPTILLDGDEIEDRDTPGVLLDAVGR